VVVLVEREQHAKESACVPPYCASRATPCFGETPQLQARPPRTRSDALSELIFSDTICYLSPVSGIHLQMLELDDSALLQEYVEHGSEEAFATLVARHVNKVYSIALRHTRNPHQAEEITQAVFVLLARKSRQLGERVILSGWLCRTARLSAMTFVRSEIRRTRREQETHMQNSLHESESEVWPQIAPLLDAAMAGLSDADHDAVALRFFDGKSMKEIGAALGASEDAAKMRVSRAVEKLRTFFTQRGIVCSAAALTAALSANAVQAAPSGLAVTISTAAAQAGVALTTTATASATNAMAMAANSKALIAGMVAVAFAAGLGTYAVQQVKARSSSARVAANASPAVAAEAADAETGILKTPDGKPLPDADVFLSTAATTVPIYSAPPPEVAIARTGADGRFSFPLAPENRAVIVVHEKGYGQITVAELVKRHELKLQPWARVEGTLREGIKPLADQTVCLSRARFGSAIERKSFRTVHDTKTKTDATGHYVFPRVAPGDAWISWRKGYDVQIRYFDIQPGQSLIADIGGRGRPITGRAVLAGGDAQVKFYGSVWPITPHQMRRPPNWSELSAEEQDSLTAAWEKSPDAKLYNQEKCPIDFRFAPDGTFTVPDLPAGNYRISVAHWANAPLTSQLISRGNVALTIPEMPGGRSDVPLEVGEIKTYPVAPLRIGDPAPLFESTTLDGKPLKLADYKGKYILLNFWRSDLPRGDEETEHLKAANAAWGKDSRFILIGLNFDGSRNAAQKYVASKRMAWSQCYFGENVDIALRYRLPILARGFGGPTPTTILIGPDGLVFRPDLRGPGITAALEEVLGTK